MKPKTISDVLKDHFWPEGVGESVIEQQKHDSALAQIQQLLEECAPERKSHTKTSKAFQKTYGMEEIVSEYSNGYNQAIDQYKSNIRGKLR